MLRDTLTDDEPEDLIEPLKGECFMAWGISSVFILSSS